MKCQDFEVVAVDLARAPSKEVATSEDALAHAETCERCAARLADERAVSVELRALSTLTGSAVPSARAEASALAAFRALEPAVAVVPHVRRRPFRSWIPAAAAAAAVCAVASALAYRATRTPSAPVAAPPTAIAGVPRPVVPTVDLTPHDPEPIIPVTTSVSHDVAGGTRFHRARTTVPRGVDRDDAGREIVTDYYPLVGASDLAPADGGQIVRLELPRSALAPFGFQMNAEHADRPITADVLLGNDGVARAIRFVQTSSSDGRR